MNKLQHKKQIFEHRLELSPTPFRRARTRTLIQLGGLIEKAGLLDVFEIPLGSDLQKDEEVKSAVAALLGSLIEIKQSLKSGELSLELLEAKGLKEFGEMSHGSN